MKAWLADLACRQLSVEEELVFGRNLRGLAIGVALAAAPATAFAVNVKSDYASGEQHVTTRYENGAALGGSLQVTRNNTGAYFRGAVDWGKGMCSLSDVGRYTKIVSSGQGRQSVGGTVVAIPGPFCGGNAKPKVSICKDVNNLPDPCGAWTGRL